MASKDLGQDDLVVGLEDLKDIGVLQKEFPKTLPEKRREYAKQFNVQYNSIRGDQCRHLEPFGTICNHWSLLESFGAFWSHLEQFGAIWSHGSM